MKQIVNARDIMAIGYKEDKILGLVLQAVQQLGDADKAEVMAMMKKLRDYPESFLDDELLHPVAKAMIEVAAIASKTIDRVKS